MGLLRATIGYWFADFLNYRSEVLNSTETNENLLPPNSNAQCSLEAQKKGGGMDYFILMYYVVEDYVTRRAPYREEHLRLAQEANRRGELILGGALGDPADRALLVFRCPDKAAVEGFVQKDPYFYNGLVARFEIQAWAVVIQ